MIDVIRGDTTNLVITVTDLEGNVVDLTGCTVFFTVKPKVTNDLDDSNAIITKQVTVHTNPSQGITTVALSSTETNLRIGGYFYDIQVKDGSGNIVSTRKDRLYIVADITRRIS